MAEMPSHRKHRARVKNGSRNASHSTATESNRPSPGTLPSKKPLSAMSKNCAKTPRQGPKKKKKADCRFLSPPEHSQQLTDHVLDYPKYPLPPARAPRTQEQFEIFLREAHHFPRLPQFRFGYTFFRQLDVHFGQPVHSRSDPNSFVPDARSPYNTPTHRYLPGNKDAYEYQKYDDLSQLDDWRIARKALPPPDIQKLPEGYLFSADYLDALASLHHFFECQRRYAGHPFSSGYLTPQTDPKKLDLEKYSPDVISLSLQRRSRGSYLKSVRAVFSSRIHFEQARTVLSSTLPPLHQRRNNKLQCFRSTRAKVGTILNLSSVIFRRARHNVVRSIVEYMLLRRNTIRTLYHVSLSSLHHTSSGNSIGRPRRKLPKRLPPTNPFWCPPNRPTYSNHNPHHEPRTPKQRITPKTQPKTQPNTHTKNQLKTQPKTQPKPQLKTQPQPKIQPNPQPEMRPTTQFKTRLKTQPKPQPKTNPNIQFRTQPKTQSQTQPTPQSETQTKTQLKQQLHTTSLSRLRAEAPPPTCPLDTAASNNPSSFWSLEFRPWLIPPWRTDFSLTLHPSCLNQHPRRLPPDRAHISSHLSHLLLDRLSWLIPPWLAKILSASPPWLVPPVPNVMILLLCLAFLQQQPWMIPPWVCPFLS